MNAKNLNFITRSKGGTDEHQEKLDTLEIKDLWGCGNTDALDVWRLAHDLKRELLEERSRQAQLIALIGKLEIMARGFHKGQTPSINIDDTTRREQALSQAKRALKGESI